MNSKITKPVIAIDGTAASGKGTLARKMAEILDFSCLDTGKLYRYIGCILLQAGKDPADEEAALAAALAMQTEFSPKILENSSLSSNAAGTAASVVAAMPSVRAALLQYQRDFAANPPDGTKGAILDGRDIGTVICPAAPLKLYIDAALGIRAERRFKELQSKGISVTYDAVLADMRERDRRDSGRSTAPMKPADDAIVLDTSHMDIDTVLQKALSLTKDRLGVMPKQ